MARVRVAHVIHNLHAGGAERRLVSVLAGLDRDHFEPLLLCVDDVGELGDDVRSLGVEPILLGRAGRRDLRPVPRLARLFRDERVDVVHGWLSLASVFGRVAGALARVPVRIAAEGGAVTTRDASRARRDARLERALVPITQAYVANSQAVAASLRAKGVPAGRIEVIPNGVAVPEPPDAVERQRIRAELGAPPGATLVGMVARLDPDFKDHGSFLAALATLAAEGRPVHGVVVGEGPARAALEQRASEPDLAGRVAFTGYRDDAPQLAVAFDVSVLLTYSEGFSNVVLESMAAGVPLVTTDIPPNLEAVEDGVTGLLVPVGDVGATVAALRRLTDDVALRSQLGTAARRLVTERFSLEAQSAATAALYERLLALRRRRP